MEATFKSGRNLATATVVLLAITAVVEIGLSIGWAMMAQSSYDDPGTRVIALGVVSLLAMCSMMLFIATAVTFSMWIYRATANLPALGSLSCRFTPAGAVWAFYIPFVNLVRGHQVMAMIWTESQPLPLTDEGYLKPRSIAIVNWWWGLVITRNVLGWIVSWALTSVTTAAEASAFFMLPSAVAAILCLVMVHKADARQRAQAEDLARRASVPQPTGMELR
jgi:hypothetical protein